MDQDRTRGAPEGDVPSEEATEEEFPQVANEPLAEQTDLVDAEGDDIRHDTGEPVPTEHGNVAPQQMATGAERTVGGGEWPDAPQRGTKDDAAAGGDADDR